MDAAASAEEREHDEEAGDGTHSLQYRRRAAPGKPVVEDRAGGKGLTRYVMRCRLRPMPGIRVERFAEPTALLLGLGQMRRRGVTPRGLLFVALDSAGAIHMAVPENVDDIGGLKVGDKLGLVWPLEGRYFHYDSVHRLREGFYLFNGDRRLAQPGDAIDVASLIADFLKASTASNVFFGCTAHQPGSWLVGGRDRVALHEAGFVEVVPVPTGLLARRIMDDRLWLLTWARLAETGRVDSWDPIYRSPFGNVLMLERRVIDDRLVLSCQKGLVELDLAGLPRVVERAKVALPGGFGVVGRVAGTAFAVTQGKPEAWGLDAVKPAVLIGATECSLAELGRVLAEPASAI